MSIIMGDPIVHTCSEMGHYITYTDEDDGQRRTLRIATASDKHGHDLYVRRRELRAEYHLWLFRKIPPGMEVSEFAADARNIEPFASQFEDALSRRAIEILRLASVGYPCIHLIVR